MTAPGKAGLLVALLRDEHGSLHSLHHAVRLRARRAWPPAGARVRRSEYFFPVEVGRNIARDIPGAQLMVVPGAGHGTFMQRPELMNLAVLQFLDSEPAPAH